MTPASFYAFGFILRKKSSLHPQCICQLCCDTLYIHFHQ